ncbi:MAG: carbamoyl-phosphate synthase large subunit, partial [Actinobacteria bacterium]|nr:carbamoyl-phosphate synthase large subunit [Actinomycetota bacterium]
SYILGGAGTGIAKDEDEFAEIARFGLAASPISEILVEESIAGWKEFELEVMRDGADNAVIVCSIENLDPMGVHTGDSITVAPAQTLTDVEYQLMRDAAFRVIRRIGVETGGSNIQFAVNPADGEMVVIEMNPRVSRSSALASKATGFPIAKIATKLAVGYRLDEVRNDITRLTPASFEPSIDYVVTKVPRWAFEKFPGVAPILSTRMQSVGEAMAIGRTFAESLQKALRSIELGRWGLGADPADKELEGVEAGELVSRASVATPNRIFEVEAAMRAGASVEDLYAATQIDPWFLHQIMRIVQEKEAWKGHEFVRGTASEIAEVFSKRDFMRAKRLGFSDAQLAHLLGVDAVELTAARKLMGVPTIFKTVDTCAAEFEAKTPYHYSSYDAETEVRTGAKPKVIILGSGPNRIGQGLEFDYCCVHASYAESIKDLTAQGAIQTHQVLRRKGKKAWTDTYRFVNHVPLREGGSIEVIEAETAGGAPLHGVIVSLGGQTPLKLAQSISPALVLGTSPDSIDAAEDRKRWAALCDELRIPQPAGATVTSLPEALAAVTDIGYPVLVRPSYVLGGRAMEIVYDREEMVEAFSRLEKLSAEGEHAKDRPILIDSFLEDAI